MRIYRVDGKEQTEIPTGIQIARDGKSTPVAPPNHPHKVEYIETSHAQPVWILVCDHKRNFQQELATALHGKFCHHNHEEACGWHYGKWDDPRMDATRQKYLDKADAMMAVIQGYLNPTEKEAAYNFALRILNAL